MNIAEAKRAVREAVAFLKRVNLTTDSSLCWAEFKLYIHESKLWLDQAAAALEGESDETCPKCGGRGVVGETGAIQERTTCPICRGAGKAQPLGENEVYAIVKGGK